MEVEYDSANSGCSGAFERRRETSTMEEFKADIKKDIQDMKYAQEQDIHRMDSAIHDYKVAMETKMEEMMQVMKTMMNPAVKLQEDIQEVKNGEKEAKATMRAKAQARAAAKARKRAKAKQRKQVKLDGDLDGSTEAEAISGGDAITVDERMQSGDEDDSSVPVIGRDAATSVQGVELSLGGASDGTFCEANVGGDNDEKYEEDDFSISEVLPAPCDSDRIVGMCFQNVNVERVFKRCPHWLHGVTPVNS